MKDVQSYLESGILELYVLGDVTPQEKLQVEEMMAAHPVVKIEVDEIERTMEKYAMANSVEPSANLQSKVLSSTVINLADDRTFKTKEPVADNVVHMTPPINTNFYKYAFAASLALLVAATAALYNVSNKLEQSNQQLLVISAQNQQFASTVSLKDKELSVFRDTTFKMVKLKGTPKAPDAAVTVAWNPVNKKVMIDMVDMKLPSTDEAHQYQLWAIVDGKPVDLGLFNKPVIDTADMVEMKSVALAQAFAVTREPMGGSRNPTMDEMVVIKML